MPRVHRPASRLAFDATIAGVKIEAAKYASESGKLILTLVVNQPKPPAEPSVPWHYQKDGAWKPEPSATLKRQKAETDEAFAGRTQTRANEIAEYRKARASYDDEMETYAPLAAAYGLRLFSFAQLIGITGVFGGKVFGVTLTPSNQNILPGFELDLNAEPLQLLEAPGRSDDYDA